MAVDNDREVNQEVTSGGLGTEGLTDGETRMWNAEEVREAAEAAAAEWDARCEAQEQDAVSHMEEQGQQEPVVDVPLMTSKGSRRAGEENKGSKENAGRNKRGKRKKRRDTARNKRVRAVSKKARAARILLGIVAAAAIGVGGYYGYRYYRAEILPGRQYNRAVELRDDGALDDAIAVFIELGEWGDAADQVLVTELMKARSQIDAGTYEDALVTLAAVGDYAGTDELVTQDLIDEANQALSDIAYSEGLDLVRIYDFDAAADQFAAAQAYMAREDAAELQNACENAYDEVYASSFAEGRDADEDLQMTMYLWVHSVITPGEETAPLGMQSDLSTGTVNANAFGQAYMNYVYYGEENERIYTFSYAGSEKDSGDDSRQVFLVATFSEDYEQVTTSKVYQDTGEVPAAPDIRIWNRVTDAGTIDAVQAGIRTRLAMDLAASGELDSETYAGEDHTFEVTETIEDGFTLKTTEEIAAEKAAAAEQADEDDASDADEQAEAEALLAELGQPDEGDEADASDGDNADDNNDDADAEGTTDYASMSEEEKKARAEALEQQEEAERKAAQQEAVEGLASDYAILVDAATGEILVDKDADTRMYPASMTKIMTILVAAENVTDLTQRAEITNDIIAYASERGLTTVGFTTGEKATVADLMWGTALCSGADAAKALAGYVAGSETNFVDLMNAKVQELGLEDTHFANCTGVFSEDNYTTPHDMALIVHAAVQNPLARTILSTRQYTTSFTTEHPAGITITNAFLRSMDQDLLPGVVLSAKTGFVSKSMFCAASYMIADDGEIYICVTGHADTSALCRGDHASLYNAFAVPPSHTDIEKYLEEILAGESSNVGTIAAAEEE